MKNRVKLNDCKCELIIARGNGKTTRFKELVEESMKMKIEILDKDLNVLNTIEDSRECAFSVGGNKLNTDKFGLSDTFISFFENPVLDTIKDSLKTDNFICFSRGETEIYVAIKKVLVYEDEIAVCGKSFIDELLAMVLQ